jgi:hypothetical protein
MIIEDNLPQFLSKAMKYWLQQYYSENFDSITEIGLFEWSFIPNRRNPTKPRRVPVIGESIKLKESIYNNSLYLFEIEANTIHVLMNNGYYLSGYSVAYEYIWNGDAYVKQSKRLLSIIR